MRRRPAEVDWLFLLCEGTTPARSSPLRTCGKSGSERRVGRRCGRPDLFAANLNLFRLIGVHGAREPSMGWLCGNRGPGPAPPVRKAGFNMKPQGRGRPGDSPARRPALWGARFGLEIRFQPTVVLPTCVAARHQKLQQGSSVIENQHDHLQEQRIHEPAARML